MSKMFNAICLMMDGSDRPVTVQHDDDVTAKVMDLRGDDLPVLPASASRLNGDLRELKKAGLKEVMLVTVIPANGKVIGSNHHLAHLSEAPKLGIAI